MDVNLLSSSLKKDTLLKEIIYFPKIESTNTYAQILKFKDDTLVLTNHQTKGKGRFGRSWISEEGKNLAFTLVKKIKVHVDEIQLLNLYTAYSLVTALKKMFSDISKEFYVKWPNDILFKDKKVAGILIEVQNLKETEKTFLIGIGLNVNQTEFDPEISFRATSLRNELNSEIEREKILIEFINFFYENVQLIDSKRELIKNWEAQSAFMNKKVIFKQMEDSVISEGIAKGLDENCGLIIELKDGTVKTFYSGEISFVY
jgi:BirA family biotin operon repressor/biotin-[acetyl-CoA-carboxylase] ligase